MKSQRPSRRQYGRTRVNSVRASAILATLCAFAAPKAIAQEEASPEATAGLPAESASPATGPAAETATTSAPFAPPAEERRLALPITVAPSVQKALDYSPEERQILQDVRDGDGQLDAPALYVLLRRAQMLPPGAQTYDEAEQPNPKSFWTEPARYRGRLVRVDGVRVGELTDWSDQMADTPWWDRRGGHVLYLKVDEIPEPVLVFLTSKPPRQLVQRLRIAGLFYKLVRLPENPQTGDRSVTHEYPVIAAKILYATAPGANFPAGIYAMFALVLALVAVFLILRRQIGRRNRAEATRRYRPPRFQLTPRRDEDEPPQETDQVDEELQRQLEQYRRDQLGKGQTKDADEPNDPC